MSDVNLEALTPEQIVRELDRYIVRHLVENAVALVHEERLAEVREKAEALANERLISALVSTLDTAAEGADESVTVARRPRTEQARQRRQRRAVAKMLADRKLEEQIVEIEIESDEGFGSAMEFVSGMSAEDLNEALQDFVAHLQASRRHSRQVSGRAARRIPTQGE